MKATSFTQLRRRPFARETIIRKQEAGTCEWCGGTNARGKVYRYGTSPDGWSRCGTQLWEGHVYCSMQCHDTDAGRYE